MAKNTSGTLDRQYSKYFRLPWLKLRSYRAKIRVFEKLRQLHDMLHAKLKFGFRRSANVTAFKQLLRTMYNTVHLLYSARSHVLREIYHFGQICAKNNIMQWDNKSLTGKLSVKDATGCSEMCSLTVMKQLLLFWKLEERAITRASTWHPKVSWCRLQTSELTLPHRIVIMSLVPVSCPKNCGCSSAKPIKYSKRLRCNKNLVCVPWDITTFRSSKHGI